MRCGGCTGWRPDVAVADDALSAARAYLRTRDVPVHPRRRWAAGLGDVKGNIAADERPAVGRALGAGAESGWGDAVRELLAADPGSEEYRARLAEVVDGCVKVLARWDWPARPAVIVPVPSRRHQHVLDDVCGELSRLGRLPVVPAVSRAADTPPQSAMGNSTFKARNALEAYAVHGSALAGAPVLLVDVAADSGWTLTVLAWRLARAGVGPVLPLVLSTRG
jgi:ATP-dependent DNA helicase RecQ